MMTVGNLKKIYDKLFSNLINRRGLFKNIVTSLTVNKLYKDLINTLSENLEKIYDNEFEKTSNLFNTKIKSMNKSKVIKEKINKKDFIDRMKRNARTLIKDIKFIKDKDNLKIRLISEFKRTKLLFRNEKHRVQEKTKSLVYDRVKPDNYKKVWKARLKNTRDTHIYLNNKYADENGYFHSSSGHIAKHPKGFGVAKEDINCNCTIVFKQV